MTISRSAANGILRRNSKLAISRVTHLVVVVVVIVVDVLVVAAVGAEWMLLWLEGGVKDVVDDVVFRSLLFVLLLVLVMEVTAVR